MLPFITVIIPTFNYGQFIVNSINSVLNQSYPRHLIEIIVIDDGSTDNTAEVVKPFVDHHMVIYVPRPNSGKASATREGIQRAKGSYIFNLDADDFFFPDKIKKVLKVFEQFPSVVHVSAPAKYINEEKNESFIENIPSFLINKESIGTDVLLYFYSNKILFGGGSTFAARASALNKVAIPGDIDMYIDEYLIIAAMSQGNTYFISEPLSAWRIHGNNYSIKKDKSNYFKRSERLSKSSEGTLRAIKKIGLSNKLVDMYELQHRIRVLSFKEESGDKSWTDILKFTLYILTCKLSFRTLFRHAAFNRLLPTTLLFSIKKLKRQK